MKNEFTKYTVAVGLLRCGKCYVSQRTSTRNFSGRWQFAGGKLEPSERPKDGAVREVAEETGLVIDTERLRQIGCIYGDSTTYVCYVYIVELNASEIPKRTENTMTEWQLLTLDEILKLNLMPGLEKKIRKLKDM